MSNLLESHLTFGPSGKSEECAKFTIDIPSSPFTLNDILTIGQEYTFSFWLMSDAVGSLSTGDAIFPSSTSWQKYTITFVADYVDLLLKFDTAGTYYIYHPQLEIGNKASDWTPAPEDVEEATNNAQEDASTALATSKDNTERIEFTETLIQTLADSIASLVRDGSGGSLIKQDSSGLWYFNLGEIEQNLSNAANGLDELSNDMLDANGNIDVLKLTAEALQSRTEYVFSGTDPKTGEPILLLGDPASPFSVRISNSEMQFLEDTEIPARINRKMLIIEKTMVKQELQFGDEEDEGVSGVWIWKRRANGNLGLMWKDVVS